MTLIGFAFGAQPLFGYTYSSRNVSRFRKTLRFAYILEVSLGSFFAVILFFTAPFLLRFFISENQVVNVGTTILRYMQLSSLLMGFSLVTICVCQAVGHASGALILSICRQGILFFIMITVFTALMGFTGILLAQPAADLLTGMLAFIIVSGILKKIKPGQQIVGKPEA